MYEEIDLPPNELPHGGLRERKKLLVQATIEDAALRLFQERGYEETSIQDIADAVMMSPRTFFRYFASKEEVLFAPMQLVFNTAIPFVEHFPPTEPLASVLYATFAHIASLYQQQPARFYTRCQVATTTPSLAANYLYHLAMLESVLCKLLAQRESTGLSERRMLLLVATSMTAFRVALQIWLENKATGNLASLVHEHLELLLSGQLLSLGQCRDGKLLRNIER